MAKKYYNRKYMRQHYATKTWISNDGKYVERDYFDKDSGTTKTYKPIIYDCSNGGKCIELKAHGTICIDELVITCYCPPKPNDGKEYIIHHKDWDMKNNHCNNLEWVEETDAYLQQRAIKRKELWYKQYKITVDKNGVIKQDKKPLSIIDYMYDRDLNWTYHYTNPWVQYSYKNPWGRYESKSLKAEEIMIDFGFVAGNKANFTNPAVLHINNDYMDFTPGNLEWCDKTDQPYLDFMKIAHDDKMQRDKKYNYPLSQGSWRVIYGAQEPYQDWSVPPQNQSTITNP